MKINRKNNTKLDESVKSQPRADVMESTCHQLAVQNFTLADCQELATCYQLSMQVEDFMMGDKAVTANQICYNTLITHVLKEV